MTLREKNQNFFQKYHALLAPLFAVLMGYAGVNGYGDYQQYRAENGGSTDVTVTVEAPSEAAPHTHPDKVRSNSDIDSRVKAILADHKCRYHGVCDG